MLTRLNLYLTLVLVSSLALAVTAPDEIVLVVPAAQIRSNGSISFGYDNRGHPLYKNKKFIGVESMLNFTTFYPNNSFAMDAALLWGSDCSLGTGTVASGQPRSRAPLPGIWSMEVNVTLRYPTEFVNDQPKCSDNDTFVFEGPWTYKTTFEELPPGQGAPVVASRNVTFKLDPPPRRDIKVGGAMRRAISSIGSIFMVGIACLGALLL